MASLGSLGTTRVPWPSRFQILAFGSPSDLAPVGNEDVAVLASCLG
jgi:hypothetical protein